MKNRDSIRKRWFRMDWNGNKTRTARRCRMIERLTSIVAREGDGAMASRAMAILAEFADNASSARWAE